MNAALPRETPITVQGLLKSKEPQKGLIKLKIIEFTIYNYQQPVALWFLYSIQTLKRLHACKNIEDF